MGKSTDGVIDIEAVGLRRGCGSSTLLEELQLAKSYGRLMKHFVVAVLLMVFAAQVSADPMGTFTIKMNSAAFSGPSRIDGASPPFCLEVDPRSSITHPLGRQNSPLPGIKVVTCNGGDNQRFGYRNQKVIASNGQCLTRTSESRPTYVEELISREEDFCYPIPPSDTSVSPISSRRAVVLNTNVALRACDSGDPGQAWSLDVTNRFLLKSGDRCLSMRGGGGSTQYTTAYQFPSYWRCGNVTIGINQTKPIHFNTYSVESKPCNDPSTSLPEIEGNFVIEKIVPIVIVE